MKILPIKNTPGYCFSLAKTIEHKKIVISINKKNNLNKLLLFFIISNTLIIILGFLGIMVLLILNELFLKIKLINLFIIYMNNIILFIINKPEIIFFAHIL